MTDLSVAFFAVGAFAAGVIVGRPLPPRSKHTRRGVRPVANDPRNRKKLLKMPRAIARETCRRETSDDSAT